MNLSQIECFCAVAETLSFSDAAKRLYISQPAASRMVSSLEKELGMELLQRDTRHVALTPAGEVMFKSFQTIMNNYANGIAQARMTEQGLVGSLKIGIMRDTFNENIPAMIHPFHIRHPKVRIEIEGFSHSEIGEALRDGRVDVAFGSTFIPARGEEKVCFANANRTKDVAILPKGHPLAARDSIYLSELAKEDFIIMSRIISTPGYDHVMQMTTQAGFSPHIVAYAKFIPELLTMVACGMGVSILGESTASLASGHLEMIPLKLINPTWSRIEWLEGNDNPCLKLFLQEARLNPDELA